VDDPRTRLLDEVAAFGAELESSVRGAAEYTPYASENQAE